MGAERERERTETEGYRLLRLDTEERAVVKRWDKEGEHENHERTKH
jgi:hypothetical protein